MYGSHKDMIDINDMNSCADHWRYEIGPNVIPFDTRNRIPKINWKEFQDKPIPEQLHKKMEG